MRGKYLLALVAGALLWLPFAALSDNHQRLIDRYATLAGSRQNATSLVTGLRDGTKVTLKRAGTTGSFTPPTGKMDYGHVDTALALAESSLKERKITRPTPAQLEATMMDILKMRAGGSGWSQIAQKHGYKLAAPKAVAKPEPVATAERPEKSK